MSRAGEVQFLRFFDGELTKLWKLGRNMIIGWCPEPAAIDVLVVPQFLLADFFSDHEDILLGPSQMTRDRLQDVADICEIAPYRIQLTEDYAKAVTHQAIERIVRRYSVRKCENRAAILFDIVNFSLYSPLEQVTVLNSLSYSINVAQRRASERGIKVALARSTTGDGFYVWNRSDGFTADLDLYSLMVLTLADNAVAKVKARTKTVPTLRSCFHIGTSFEYFQAHGVSPVFHSYMVGDLTIELARMIGAALPAQALIGDFQTELAYVDAPENTRRVDAPMFVAAASERLDALQDVILSREKIGEMRCYLTGGQRSDGKFNINRYGIEDKHGIKHQVFNAKLNIHTSGGRSIYLGLQNKDLADFDAKVSVYRPADEVREMIGGSVGSAAA